LALPTPTKSTGENAGKAYDLSYTEKGLVNILNYYNSNPDKMEKKVIIIEKSTVPIGTSKMISKIISSVSNPELK
jgi:UDP-glucose 6-dehydrogenase